MGAHLHISSVEVVVPGPKWAEDDEMQQVADSYYLPKADVGYGQNTVGLGDSGMSLCLPCWIFTYRMIKQRCANIRGQGNLSGH